MRLADGAIPVRTRCLSRSPSIEGVRGGEAAGSRYATSGELLRRLVVPALPVRLFDRIDKLGVDAELPQLGGGDDNALGAGCDDVREIRGLNDDSVRLGVRPQEEAEGRIRQNVGAFLIPFRIDRLRL